MSDPQPDNLHPDTLLKALAEPTRLRIVLLLLHNDELCVCHLQQMLALSQPKISRHLKALRDSGVVSDRREGQWVHYRLNPALPGWAQQVINALAAGAAAAGEPLATLGDNGTIISCQRG